MPEAVQIRRDARREEGMRIAATVDGQEVGHVYVYFLHNDLHEAPFALVEDLAIDERGTRAGAWIQLLRTAISESRARGCYKLIGTSRHGRESLHLFYDTVGAPVHGVSFRMDLS
jgi:GNAT superfamily N-acetyltransferase